MIGSVGAARKVSLNWSQETTTCHFSNWFSIVWGQGNAPLVTSLPSFIINRSTPRKVFYLIVSLNVLYFQSH